MRDAETIPPDSPSSRETAPPMMEVPTVATASPSAFSTEPTNSLDRYELLEPIGHGGMGSVFRARQRKPLDRIVALKLIRAGFAAPSIVARFVAEFRMQSRLEHPSIARVFDAGVNETGQPFFVMEYVPGKPLPVFADEHRLDIEARLKLFMDVCDAIAHAHARAVIHRDLKAANVLAFMQDGRPMVKVIDFGVAKILDETGEAKAYATQAGSSIGTFQTMSPEQAAGRSDLDTRTDVYSLGVMLYQLLIGRVPLDDHDVKGLDYFRLAKLVAEVEPTRPSERLARDENREAIAQMRQTKPEALISQLARELEWIPMYALRKDRERRYASAEQMREDIENYFSGRPLRAAPESRLYVARKFASRNRLALSAAGAVALVSVAAVGLISSAVQRERASQQRALEEKLTASALNDFMLEDLIGRMSPGESGVSVSLNDAFSSAVESFSGRFDSQPILQVRIRKTFAEALLGVGELDRAAETFASIEAELPRLPQLEDRFKAEVEMGAEEVRWRLGKIDSVASLRSTLKEMETRFGNDDSLVTELRCDLASSIKNTARDAPLKDRLTALDEAASLYRQAIKAFEKSTEPDERLSYFEMRHSLAELSIERGNRLGRTPADDPMRAQNIEQSLQFYEQAMTELTALRAEAGNDLSLPRSYLLEIDCELAKLLHRQRKRVEAHQAYKNLIDPLHEVFGATHWRVAEIVNSWVSLHAKWPDTDPETSVTERAKLAIEAHTTLRRWFMREQPDVLRAVSESRALARARETLGETESAERLWLWCYYELATEDQADPAVIEMIDSVKKDISDHYILINRADEAAKWSTPTQHQGDGQQQ